MEQKNLIVKIYVVQRTAEFDRRQDLLCLCSLKGLLDEYARLLF